MSSPVPPQQAPTAQPPRPPAAAPPTTAPETVVSATPISVQLPPIQPKPPPPQAQAQQQPTLGPASGPQPPTPAQLLNLGPQPPLYRGPICWNSYCKDPDPNSFGRRGWKVRSGPPYSVYADLCGRCYSQFEQGIYCETFHSEEGGWRNCESCGTRVHCGCIMSIHKYQLRDAGGVDCAKCARSTRAAMAPPSPVWTAPIHSSQNVSDRRPRMDAKARSQLLPHYWPRITDQELQHLSSDSNSVITPLFEKVLSASDAGRIGRLVLPKKCAEAYFPPISQPEGLPLKVLDASGKEWIFQFRFWPNNNSRMYVLEGVTPCIQAMQLQEGDTVTFSRIDPEGKLIMGFRKAIKQTMELNILERVVAGSEKPSHLDLSLLQSITENFSEQRKIGVGGCGEVYKGSLQNGIVAVKRLFSNRTIKDKMFHREVQSLITVRHENIVQLLGYCSFTEERVFIFEGRTIMADIRERLLCFEYISNGNLENHLADELRGLEWHTRYKIIVGICKGLLYLHKAKDIVHMDLKPANILLDNLMVPKITDFGLSRLDNNSQVVTTSRLISPGYCAPEYIDHGIASRKSDIYSLGVMVIELVTGSRKKPDLTKVLRRWRYRWIKSSKHSPLGYQQVTKCLKLAQRCIQINPTARPDIVYIMDELNTIDSKGGQFQEIPCLEDMLGIEPLEIHFPFELDPLGIHFLFEHDPQLSHSVELNNDTDDCIAFMTKARSRRFSIEPDKGIVPPGSKCSVTVTMQAQVNALPNNHHKEEITVLSTRVDGGLAAMDITRDVFIEKVGNVVDEVNVIVVFDKPPPADEES